MLHVCSRAALIRQRKTPCSQMSIPAFFSFFFSTSLPRSHLLPPSRSPLPSCDCSLTLSSLCSPFLLSSLSIIHQWLQLRQWLHQLHGSLFFTPARVLFEWAEAVQALPQELHRAARMMARECLWSTQGVCRCRRCHNHRVARQNRIGPFVGTLQR